MKKKNKKKRTNPLRRFSPLEHQNIRNLSDLFCKLLPATSRGDYCLEKIARKEGLGKYFNYKLGNKRKQFIFFIQNTYGRHPVKFKKIVNNVLAEAVEWRRLKGDPILRPEAELLKELLLTIGINLRKEIDELKLPTQRPKITPPPIFVKQALEKFGLHPSLLDEVLPLFSDGYLNEAVRKAGEIYELLAIKASGLGVAKKYGRDLMASVFNSSNPIIDISGYHKSEILNPVDEKEGYMYLAMGAMHWCKNIMGHGDADQLSPADAASRIIMVSHLIEVAEYRPVMPDIKK